MSDTQVAHIMALVEEYAVLREHGSAAQYDAAGRAIEAALRESPQQAEGWVMVPVEIVDRFPEINTSNYDHDDACALNAWGVELVLAARPSAPTAVEPVQDRLTTPATMRPVELAKRIQRGEKWEVGLSDDIPRIGCVNHDCDECRRKSSQQGVELERMREDNIELLEVLERLARMTHDGYVQREALDAIRASKGTK